MENVMVNGFVELASNEMELIDGGKPGFGTGACLASAVYDTAILACGALGKYAGVAACAAIASNPVVIGVGAALTIGGLAYGAYCFFS